MLVQTLTRKMYRRLFVKLLQNLILYQMQSRGEVSVTVLAKWSLNVTKLVCFDRILLPSMLKTYSLSKLKRR